MFDHKFCVTVDWMRYCYNRSPSYTVCNATGERDDHGMYVLRPSGKIERITGHCDYPDDPAGCTSRHPQNAIDLDVDEALDKLRNR